MNFPLRFNLQTRYSAQILLVVVVSILCLTLASLWQLADSARQIEKYASTAFSEHLVDQHRERGRVMSDYLAENLTNPLMRYDFATMRALLRTTLGQQDVAFALVFDAGGKILHDGSDAVATFGRPVSDVLGWQAGSLDAPRQELRDRMLHVVRPVLLDANRLGGVAVGISLVPVNDQTGILATTLSGLTRNALRREVTVAAFLAMLCLLGGGIVALVSGRRLARPIRDLALQAQRLGQGRFDRPVTVNRSDEIGDLAAAFNSMSQDLQASHQDVRFLAYHDALTGLPNRAKLMSDLEDMCARARQAGQTGAALFIDLDDFKPVNDTLGHEAGDSLLIETAERLLRCMESEPCCRWVTGGSARQSVARLGGDEFVVVLENIASPDDAGSVARLVLEELSAPFSLRGHEVTIGASIGIGIFPDDAGDGDALLGHADVAMYAAKRKGKHAFHFYESGMFEATRDRLFMINDLRRAIEEEDFEVHYQPIVSSGNSRIVGAEALIRWHHPERGLIRAAEFIDAAERSGEMERLGRWVLGRVCEDLAGWRSVGVEGLFVSLNVSSRQLLKEDLPDFVNGLLARHDLTTRDLQIEVREDRLLAGNDDVPALLHCWHQAGLEIWIDKFGLGPASLLGLRHIPARGIKLGRDFIADVESDPGAAQLLTAIIDLTRSLDLDVCAVGVSSKAQARWLREHACRYMQGEHFGAAMQAGEIAQQAIGQSAGVSRPMRAI